MRNFIQHDGSVLILDDNQAQKIEEFYNLVRVWNGLNLIAKSTEDDIFGWHFCDGLSVHNVLSDFGCDSNGKNGQNSGDCEDLDVSCQVGKSGFSQRIIIDFGAGGGVLGIPLALTGVKNLYLVERSKTKLAFLRDIAKFSRSFSNVLEVCKVVKNGLIGQNNEKVNCSLKIGFLVRGVGKIDEILAILAREIEEASLICDCEILLDFVVFLKAENVKYELAKAKFNWFFDSEKFRRKGLASGNIVILKNLCKKN